jgi:hypothetical protein
VASLAAHLEHAAVAIRVSNDFQRRAVTVYVCGAFYALRSGAGEWSFQGQGHGLCGGEQRLQLLGNKWKPAEGSRP